MTTTITMMRKAARSASAVAKKQESVPAGAQLLALAHALVLAHALEETASILQSTQAAPLMQRLLQSRHRMFQTQHSHPRSCRVLLLLTLPSINRFHGHGRRMWQQRIHHMGRPSCPLKTHSHNQTCKLRRSFQRTADIILLRIRMVNRSNLNPLPLRDSNMSHGFASSLVS